MKILQLSNRVPWPLNEGGTIGIYNFTKAFAEQGHQLTLYCLDGLKHGTPIKEAQAELSKYAELLIHPIDTDVKWDEALKNLFSSKSYNVQRFENQSFRDSLIELLQRERFDVVQLEGSFVGPYVDDVRRHHKGIISLRMHNAEFEIWSRLANNEKNPVKAFYLQLLAKRLKKYERQLLDKVDCVLAVSPNDLNKFRELKSGLIGEVFPAGIDTEFWQYTPSESCNKLYHIGSMEWHANQQAVSYFLKEVWPLLHSTDPSLSLHLAGKALDQESYSAINTQLYPKVDDAYGFVSEMDLCVVPLLSGSGIRLKILEAMSAGKIVITTSIGAQGIAYEDGVHLCIADSPEQWKEKIDLLKSDAELRTRMSQAAHTLIQEKYSIQAVSKDLIDYYQALNH